MKVRVNSIYKFNAVGWDIFDRRASTPANGTLVRVVNLPGAPKANTMGHCHIETAEGGEFIGLIMTASLEKP